MESGFGEASSRPRRSGGASLRQCLQKTSQLLLLHLRTQQRPLLYKLPDLHWIYLSDWAPYASMQGCYYYFRHSNS
ncbi:hypothetical protein U9M48_005368 [Paspalum notatum var. saurae]|uniref:Uncharacterized protein n=1 Tax=Paspalum notatum var. saurae TaxID=547442 RepID=A0AAQ3PS28_PASNO